MFCPVPVVSTYDPISQSVTHQMVNYLTLIKHEDEETHLRMLVGCGLVIESDMNRLMF